MSEGSFDIEARLRRALAPVEPSAELELRLEGTLGSLVEMAAGELEEWELSAIKDPRNWARLARPAAAVVIGSGAAIGLVVLRTQRKRHRRQMSSRNLLELAERTVRDAAREALRVFEDAAPGR
jgi:hypothetical protein